MSDLIDVVSNIWNVDVISAGFKPDDVVPILSIPLSRVGCCDILVWPYNVNGDHSVKFGYEVAVSLMENDALGKKGRGMPSECKKNTQVWNTIWKLKVPNKIKIFVWRCCNHALAVRRNLQRWNMRVDNVCGVCNMVDESKNHLFFHCNLSHQFWFCSPLHLDSHGLTGTDFHESWENFCKQVQGRTKVDEIMQEFAFGL